MNPNQDQRIVLTLDAGGTNFVFTAIRANEEVAEAVHLPSNAHDLDKCLATIFKGFQEVKKQLREKAIAISFAFPGPSDYLTGVVGKLTNLPAFSGGIPLGPILQHEFQLPVFINNDGDLYAYGEALSGFLPELNSALEKSGVNKRYNNLVGITLGTGFGCGIVRNQELFLGDNSMAGEVWLLRNRSNPQANAEEGVSIRAIRRAYAGITGMETDKAPSPKDIFDIAGGRAPGNKDAALEAFRQLGTVLGDALGNLLTIIDGAAVIGGGIAGAMPLIMPSLLKEIGSDYTLSDGSTYPRLVQKVYDFTSDSGRKEFLDWPEQVITLPGSNGKIGYSGDARIPLGISKIGTSRAIALGAYAFALKRLG
jgi:glucokinase